MNSLLIRTRIYGFFSNLFQILVNLKYCELNNLKPIMHLDDAFAYQNETRGKESWNNFFEDINDGIVEGDTIEITHLTDKANFLLEGFVLCSPQNQIYGLRVWEAHCNQGEENTTQARRELNALITKYLTPIQSIRDTIDEFTKTQLKGKVLSVHVRGTDYMYHDLNRFIEEIEKKQNEFNYDTIFVASDNKESIDTIAKRFPNVCYYDTSLRAEEYHSSSPTSYIVQGEDKVKHGRDVLIECNLLSKGERIICINSNVAGFATCLNPDMKIDLLCRVHGGG